MKTDRPGLKGGPERSGTAPEMLPQEHEEKEFLRVKSVKRKAELRDEGKTSDPKPEQQHTAVPKLCSRFHHI